MTENTLKLLQFLQSQNQPIQLKATANALGLSWQGVNAIFNQLVKNGLGVRVPQVIIDEATGQEKEIKLLVLTEAGHSRELN